MLAATNNYEDEVAPSMGHIRSNDDRKMCLQKVYTSDVLMHLMMR